MGSRSKHLYYDREPSLQDLDCTAWTPVWDIMGPGAVLAPVKVSRRAWSLGLEAGPEERTSEGLGRDGPHVDYRRAQETLKVPPTVLFPRCKGPDHRVRGTVVDKNSLYVYCQKYRRKDYSLGQRSEGWVLINSYKEGIQTTKNTNNSGYTCPFFEIYSLVLWNVKRSHIKKNSLVF